MSDNRETEGGSRRRSQLKLAGDRVAAGVAHAAVTPVRATAGLWRRSIQARVVIGTLTLSAVLSILAGWMLMNRVTDGLLEGKRQAAISQAVAGVDTARSKLEASDVSNFIDAGNVLNGLISVLSPRDNASNDYYVVIRGPSLPYQSSAVAAGTRVSANLDVTKTVPDDLWDHVRSQPGSWYAYSQATFFSNERPKEPALVVGSQVLDPNTGELYSLFYVFPLKEQQQTLFVVRSALITAGALLVVLLGTIAWLVTRQVVTPVRLARRIAERLASGRLEERMHVRGEDDIARLGLSFNQMADSLQRQIRQLEELSRVQRRFVADVSHELRTPLTTVRMAADVLYDGRASFDPVTERSAELLQTQLDRFELLLTDLLEISRFDAGAALLDLSDVDLRDVARRVIDAASAVAERRGSRVRLVVPPTAVLVEADARRIERIVRNLVVNAIEYGEGNDVEVQVAANADAVALSVRDQGVGLKSGEEVMVFNRFWRADPARARTRGGTGLGLSIAVEDAALHAGKLDAWGQLGTGSVFRLTLPRRAGGEFAVSPLPLEPLEPRPLTTVAPYPRFVHETRRGIR